MELNKKRWKKSFVLAGNMLKRMIPTIFGIMLLISLVNAIVPQDFYGQLFQGSYLIDPLVGASVGSIFAGNPVFSYIIGGELLEQGVGLIAVTAFIVAWVTVGVVQLPAESIMLGKKFAIIRNLVNFVFSIVVAVITVFILNFIEGGLGW